MSKPIKERFEDIDITIIIDKNGELWFRLIDIAKALGYKYPKKSVDDILRRNTEYFRDKIKTFPMSHGATEENRFLPEVEANFFVICSQQPKAKPLQFRLAEIAKSHRVMVSSLTDPLQRGLEISKQLVQVFETQIKHQKQLESMDDRLFIVEKQQEDLVQELVNITKSQRNKISNKIKEMIVNSKDIFPDLSKHKLFRSYFGILVDYFEGTRYDDIPRERFDEAIKLLDCIEKLVLARKMDMKTYWTPKQVINLCRRNALF